MILNEKNIRHQVLKTSYRSILLGVFLLLFATTAIGQINVIFDNFPVSVQLIQRDDFNQASVNISGKVYTENQTDVALIVYKNKSLFYYKKQKLQYGSQPSTAAFSITPIINAELSEYDFKFYSFRNKDSVLVKEANEVVCGDNILIYGQSNAQADAIDELPKFKDEFRYGRTTYADFTKNEFTWLITKKWNFWSSGLLGLEMQKQLIDKYQIPIGIINGAVGNKSIEELSIRDEANHASESTIYGRMLKRSKAFNLDKNVKIIIWRQGESEALDPFYKNDYDKKFEKFRKQLHEDYPGLKKIYTYQNNIYFGDNKLAGNLREYQRNINKLYADCEVMSTFGTVTFDGLHYALDGYLENGRNVARLIARDFHKSTDTTEISAPNIKKAYLSVKKDSIIIEFDKNQQMFFPKDEAKKNASHPSINIKDYIYLDGKSGNIESGTGIGNLVILKLKSPVDAQKITYTPDNYTSDFVSILPGITQIKNSRGIQALTFKDFELSKLEEKVQITNLTGEWDTVSNKKIVLNWQTPRFLNFTYTIEKAQQQPNLFYEIGPLITATFIDNKVKKGVKYYYRIKIKEINGTTTYSNIAEVIYQFSTNNQFIDPTSEDLVVFPNPVAQNNVLNLSTLFETSMKHLRITNSDGKIVYDKPNIARSMMLPINDFGQGLYIIEAVLEDNTKLIKRFVVQ